MNLSKAERPARYPFPKFGEINMPRIGRVVGFPYLLVTNCSNESITKIYQCSVILILIRLYKHVYQS